MYVLSSPLRPRTKWSVVGCFFYVLLISPTNSPASETVFHIGNHHEVPDPPLESYNGRLVIAHDVLYISGYAAGAGYKIQEKEFLELDKQSLNQSLSDYVNEYGGINRAKVFSGRVILDIEFPVHLSHLSSLPIEKLEKYFEALSKRVQVAKLIFPDAQIGLHGVYSPSYICWETPSDIRRKRISPKRFWRATPVSWCRFCYGC